MVLLAPPPFAMQKPSILVRPRKHPAWVLKPAEPDSVSRFFVASDIPPHRSFLPSNILLTGRRGMGKTLLMSGLAAAQAARYRRAHVSFSVAANYWLECADVLHARLPDWLMSFERRARRLTACIDEIAAFFPSMRATSRSNLDFGTFLTQIRKRDIELIATTQFPMDIGQAVLRQIDIFIQCESRDAGRTIQAHAHDWWGQWTGRMLTYYGQPKRWPPPIEEADWHLTFHGMSRFWGSYLSDQIQPPLWAKNRDALLMDEWGDESLFDPEVTQSLVAHEQGTAPVLAQLPDQPKTFEEVIERQRAKFNVVVILDDFQHMVPDMQHASRAKLGKWLEEHGHRVETVDRVVWCTPKHLL